MSTGKPTQHAGPGLLHRIVRAIIRVRLSAAGAGGALLKRGVTTIRFPKQNGGRAFRGAAAAPPRALGFRNKPPSSAWCPAPGTPRKHSADLTAPGLPSAESIRADPRRHGEKMSLCWISHMLREEELQQTLCTTVRGPGGPPTGGHALRKGPPNKCAPRRPSIRGSYPKVMSPPGATWTLKAHSQPGEPLCHPCSTPLRGPTAPHTPNCSPWTGTPQVRAGRQLPHLPL